jgi:hypothetical protein
MNPTNRVFMIGCGIVIVFYAAVAYAFAVHYHQFNYAIYRDAVDFFRQHGRVSGPHDVLRSGQPGSYSDFTPLNLQTYRVLFVAHSASIQRLTYLTYEATMLAIGVLVVVLRPERLGLSRLTGRLLALTVLSPAIALTTFGFLEDKVPFFTLVVLLLASPAERLWRSAMLGLVAAWGGFAGLALVLLPWSWSGRPDLSPWKRAAIATAVGLSVFVAGNAVAGSGGSTLLSNRRARESIYAFWFSIWHLLDGADSVPVRLVIAGGIALVIVAAFYMKRLRFDAALIALSAVMLLASSNTQGYRLVFFCPLGVLLFRTDRARALYLGFTSLWAAIVYGCVLANKFVSISFLATDTHEGYLYLASEVLITNSCLLVIITAALWQSTRRYSPGVLSSDSANADIAPRDHSSRAPG